MKLKRLLLIVSTCAFAVFLNKFVGGRAITGAAWILIVQPVAFALFKLDPYRYALPWSLVGVVLLVIGLKT